MTPKRPDIDLAAVRAEEELRAKGFQMIGAFIFGFSQLEFSIKDVLSRILKLRDDLFDVITSPYDFAMLCKVTKILLTRRFPQKQARIEELFKGCFALNDERTKVAHGLWIVSDDSFVARHVSRSSLKPTFFYENPNNLAQLANEAQRLIAALYGLFQNDDSAVKIIGVEHVPEKRTRKRRNKTA